MVVEVAQPDGPQMVADWLESVKEGTSLAPYRIHAHEAPPHDAPPYFLIEEAGWLHDREVPVYQPYRVALTALANTVTEAAAMWRSATNLLHAAMNQRVGDFGFMGAFDETGPQPRNDPGSWPAVFGIVALVMPDRALSL